MNESDSLKLHFETPREEIKETKDRMFKIFSYGIIVVPASDFLGRSYQIDIVMLALPFLVIVFSLLYLSENFALMRAGRYIKEKIEPKFEDLEGWETWLVYYCFLCGYWILFYHLFIEKCQTLHLNQFNKNKSLPKGVRSVT